MKKQILTLIIGILIGAIITSVIFLSLKGKAGGPNKKFDRGDMPFSDENFPKDGEFPKDGKFSGRDKNTSKPEENINTVEE